MVRVVLALLASSFFATASLADTITSWATINAFQSATTDPGATAVVNCYYAAPVPCAGGGSFHLISGSCSDNGATIIQSYGHCYARDNFGAGGIVDARQCGVVGDENTPSDATTLKNCMIYAWDNGIYRVYTGGGVILDDHTTDHNGNYNIVPFPGMELTCGANAAADRDDNDFRIASLTGAIVLDLQDTIALSKDTASLTDCNVVAGETSGGVVTNPYSPSVWFPNCNPGDPPCTNDHTPHLRSAMKEYSAFNPNPTAEYNGILQCGASTPTHCGPASQSVGIAITGNKDAVRNVTVMGFGKGYSSGGTGKGMIIDHLTVDADAGISIDSSHEETQINGFQIKPILTNADTSVLTLDVYSLVKDAPSGKYAATVVVGSTATPDFTFQKQDTLWIATSPSDGTVGGAESAAGRWTVSNDPAPPALCGGTGSFYCQTLILDGSLGEPDSRYSDSGSPLTIGATTGVTLNSTVGGVPPNAITGISTDPTSADQKTLQLIAVGQTVTDGGVCIPNGTPLPTVKDVWPAKGIVYLSQPVLATCPPDHSESVNFYDAAFHAGPGCDVSPGKGCAFLDANERFGDGIVVSNSGGVTVSACGVLEHLVAFHFSTNANSSRFANCATGENIALPDQDIIGLLIDGSHDPDPEVGGDGCGNMFVNGILGQHRTVGIVVKSNCNAPNHLSNVRFSGNGGGRRNAVALEVDAGAITIANNDSTGSDNILKADSATLYDPSHNPQGPYPASLSIGNNQFSSAALIMSDSAAAASTSGCGNTFAAPTPYLCAPSSFTQLPGGRLSLASGTSSNCSSPVPPPVMNADATNASCIFYVPYTSQNVPIYSTAAGTFGLTDVGKTGLTLNVNTTNHISGKLYDVFIETENGPPEMCTVQWTNTTSRATDVTQINGVWVNSGDVACSYAVSLTRDCLPFSCTYVGSFLATANGKTEQQFGPVSGSGGGAPCLCLYNAYNHVTVTSASADSSAAYSYSGSAWRLMNGSANNSVTVIDGLQQMQISAQLNDVLQTGSGGRAALMGIDFSPSLVSPPTPSLIVQSASTARGSYSTSMTTPPFPGLWTAQAVETAGVGTGGANFGGGGFQRLSVQVAD